MKSFADLYRTLDETTKTTVKVAAMRDYFTHCSAADGAWSVYFLSGRKFSRLIPTGLLRMWAAEQAQIPDWMFEECYGAVGDLAETMALLLPEPTGGSQFTLAEWIEQRIRPLSAMTDDQRKEALSDAWGQLTAQERFVFNKLVTGSFRVGVSQGLVIRALALVSELPQALIAHRLMGQWEPTPEFFEQLLAADQGETDESRPYPFALAHPFQSAPETLGDPADWLVEWKWDGIRGQMIRRRGQSYLWSRGEELILDRFPELAEPLRALPDGTVLDGEVLGWKAGRPLPFSELQRRIGRKSVGKKLLSDVPVRFVAFDLLERDGQDLRALPLVERRRQLEEVLESCEPEPLIVPSPVVSTTSWDLLQDQRSASREMNVEGVMLKRLDSPYPLGRVTGLWWKWKVNPFTCDAVLIYAQRGHGRRASLYTDYTFAVWDQGQLIPFAKAYSGLTDAEIRDVDRYVRQHTIEKFGPVRAVTPGLVFELAFENIQFSKRHKSGVAVRFPRMSRWRKDKRPDQADTLDGIKALMSAEVNT
ncbi:ATP-dependent DNA ligase [Planctomicrobium sp. SH664]|uniref:ATP-dependent DNA ligase n=1 Tax=Planctomicrobium sp. SH664 TaxID=3448125 RepID=UPI003F5BF20A